MRLTLLTICTLLFGPVLSLPAQVFDFVVAKDGTGTHTTIQSAIDDCPNNVRKLIFVKNGTYEERVSIGSHTSASSKLISLIGEDPIKTIITKNDYVDKPIEETTKKYTATDCGTFIVNAVDFYAENITIENTAGAVGPAIALYNVADRQTFKNCRIIGQQDTHRLRKGRRYYFKDSYIEGTVDYIYCAGPAIFDDCELRTTRSGGYVVAPEDVDYSAVGNGKKYIYNFVFRNCLLTSSGNFEYYLGRPWKVSSAAVFINSKMQGVKKEGWSDWDGRSSSAFFAEYNSMDLAGNPLDISNRASWSYQLTKDEIDTYFTPEKIYSFVTGTVYDPFTLVIAPQVPQNLTLTENKLTWQPVDNAKGYIILKDGLVMDFITGTDYTIITADTPNVSYTVESVGANGNLSNPSNIAKATGIKPIDIEIDAVFCRNGILYAPQNNTVDIFSLSGSLLKSKNNQTQINLNDLNPGIYFVKVMINGSVFFKKITI